MRARNRWKEKLGENNVHRGGEVEPVAATKVASNIKDWSMRTPTLRAEQGHHPKRSFTNQWYLLNHSDTLWHSGESPEDQPIFLRFYIFPREKARSGYSPRHGRWCISVIYDTKKMVQNLGRQVSISWDQAPGKYRIFLSVRSRRLKPGHFNTFFGEKRIRYDTS